MTLKDLEPGYRRLLRAFSAGYDLSDRTCDPIASSFYSGSLQKKAGELRRRFKVDVELGVSEAPPGAIPDLPAPLARNPHLIWHLNIGGPDYWLNPLSLHANLEASARKHLVFAFLPSPLGAIFTFPAVDDPTKTLNAMYGVMTAFSSSLRGLLSLDADSWPPRDSLTLDPRFLVGTFDLLAYADDPDERGTLFRV